MTPICPQEIIEQIIEYVDDPQRQETLRACSTVSSSFHHVAQRKLFGHAGAFWPVPGSDLEQGNVVANRRMELNPRLCSYVKSLFITLAPESKGARSLRVYTKLTQVQSITLAPNGTAMGQWFSLASGVRDQLQEMFRGPALRVLNLQNIHIPDNILRLFVQLETLGLWGVAFSKAAATSSLVEDKPKTHLRTLNLHNIRVRQNTGPLLSVFRDLSSPLSVSCLQTLRIEVWHDESVHNCEVLTQLAKSHIEELEVIISRGYAIMKLNLRDLKKLRQIRLHPMCVEALVCVPKILESALDNKALVKVDITVDADLCIPGHLYGSTDAWEAVDDLLSRNDPNMPRRFLHVTILSTGPCLDTALSILPFPSIMKRLSLARRINVSWREGASHLDTINALKSSVCQR